MRYRLVFAYTSGSKSYGDFVEDNRSIEEVIEAVEENILNEGFNPQYFHLMVHDQKMFINPNNVTGIWVEKEEAK